MDHRDKTFEGERITLDDNRYSGCTFKKCTLIYRGGPLPSLSANSFRECQWVFEDGAQRTLIFLKALFHGGGRELVEATIANLRAP